MVPGQVLEYLVSVSRIK